MKRIVLAFAIVTLAVAPAMAQNFNLTEFKDSFSTFNTEFANSLPMNATIGLNWSDAYIGQLLPIPSLGVGVTTGVTTIPGSVFDDLQTGLGITPSSGALASLSAVGLPLPGYAFDARVGGLILPFDVGLKFGVLPATSIGEVSAEYQNIGFDVRYALLDGGILPKVSVAVGYNRLTGRISTPLGIGSTDLTSVTVDSTDYTVTLSDPNLEFDWAANVIDFRVQASKSFLIVEPHIGFGATLGSAETNAGLTSSVSVSDGSATKEQISAAAGIDLDDQGVTISSSVNPFTFRAFGGMSLNLLLFRFDLGAMYNITSGALGGTLGVRFQM